MKGALAANGYAGRLAHRGNTPRPGQHGRSILVHRTAPLPSAVPSLCAGLSRVCCRVWHHQRQNSTPFYTWGRLQVCKGQRDTWPVGRRASALEQRALRTPNPTKDAMAVVRHPSRMDAGSFSWTLGCGAGSLTAPRPWRPVLHLTPATMAIPYVNNCRVLGRRGSGA